MAVNRISGQRTRRSQILSAVMIELQRIELNKGMTEYGLTPRVAGMAWRLDNMVKGYVGRYAN